MCKGVEIISGDEITNGIAAVGLLIGGTVAISAIAPVCPPLAAALGKVLPMGVTAVAKDGPGCLFK